MVPGNGPLQCLMSVAVSMLGIAEYIHCAVSTTVVCTAGILPEIKTDSVTTIYWSLVALYN